MLGPGLPEQLAAGQLVPVTGGMQVADFHREVEAGQQLTGNDQPTVHHAVNNRIAVLQLAGDRTGHVVHGRFDLLLGVQTIRLIHHLLNVI